MEFRYSNKLVCNLDTEYKRRLDSWVSSRWPYRESNWEEFLTQLPGFYPIDVWDSIKRLGFNSPELGTEAQAIVRNVQMEAFPDALEHPLDFEWRFVDDSISTILVKLRQLLPEQKFISVGCLGCPNVAVAGERKLPNYSWTLLDRRAELLRPRVKKVELIACDLTQDFPRLPSWDAAVVDPPWYLPITKHFLVRAQMLTKQGGFVLLSFPPEGTRPGARRELDQLIDWCNQGGLERVEISYGKLQYKTPFFESNALKSAGFSANVPSWRKADMLVFVNRRENGRGVICDDQIPERLGAEWQIFSREGVKFFLRIEPPVKSVTKNVPVVKRLSPAWRHDQILPSVSTNFPGREKANLVSSGNRFLICDDTFSVAQLLRTWESNGLPFESKGPCPLQTQLSTIIEDELHDKENYLMHTYDRK